MDYLKIANALNDANDEVLASAMVAWYKLFKKGDVIIDKTDMNSFDLEGFISWLKDVLDEIIFSKEIDSLAWWKEPEAKKECKYLLICDDDIRYVDNLCRYIAYNTDDIKIGCYTDKDDLADSVEEPDLILISEDFRSAIPERMKNAEVIFLSEEDTDEPTSLYKFSAMDDFMAKLMEKINKPQFVLDMHDDWQYDSDDTCSVMVSGLAEIVGAPKIPTRAYRDEYAILNYADEKVVYVAYVDTFPDGSKEGTKLSVTNNGKLYYNAIARQGGKRFSDFIKECKEGNYV